MVVSFRLTPLRYDGSSWKTTSVGPAYKLRWIWGSGSTDVFAVGQAGLVLYFDGTNWNSQASTTNVQLYGVWGNSATDVYAVGGEYKKDDVVLHYDGKKWSTVLKNYPKVKYFYSVWGSGPSNVFVAGGSKVLRFDGITWQKPTWDYGEGTSALWGTSATNFYFLIYSHYVRRCDGKTAKTVVGNCCVPMYSISGSGAKDVHVVGERYHTYHYDGKAWNNLLSGTANSLRAVWVSSAGDVFAVGKGGTILYRGP